MPRTLIASILLLCLPQVALASAAEGAAPDLTSSWVGISALVAFVVAYVLVVFEERLHLRKSIPVLIAAAVIWTLVGIAYAQIGETHAVSDTLRHSLLEFAELFLFLLVAMTFINTLDDRGVFEALRGVLVAHGFSLRTLYWLTGVLAFFLSPIADNMTTALVMASVVVAVGGKEARFVGVACINIVVAANAGGAWSPFGDITTLMVWQKGIFPAHEFLVLFFPSLISWLVPAAIMSMSIPNARPEPLAERPQVQFGGYVIIALFLGTIALTVTLHTWLHLPPVLGMMAGMGVLMLVSYGLNRTPRGRSSRPISHQGMEQVSLSDVAGSDPHQTPTTRLNTFNQIARSEWDTLLFFYGIIMCVGGLGTIGYLAMGSDLMYGQLGPTIANVLVGVFSAVIDNIPVMFAVLSMLPEMSDGQWLLVTLTAGIGGSMLSIGSAAGVAVMGSARGVYTFFGHLRWSWAIALGYAAGIAAHFMINAHYFELAGGK